MNYRTVFKYLGQFTIGAGALMVFSMPWAIYFGEWHALGAFAASVALTASFGAGLYLSGRNCRAPMYQRESLALVGLGWLVTCVAGALPFLFSGTLKFVDALFESTSGFTTTGASVLTDIEAVDKSILFWRSFTHWAGGMGIVLMFIAVLPYLGAGGKQLFKSETSALDPHKFGPHIRDTASSIYKIYLAFTAAQTLLLMAAGMDLFDALCHTFGTLATGGFSTRNASVAAYDSLPIEIIIIVFMLLGSGSFAIYFSMMRGDWRAPFRNTEWKAYYLMLFAAVILVTLNLIGLPGPKAMGIPESFFPNTPEYTAAGALRSALFQVVSISTTTGFCTDDFDVYPHFSRLLLVLLMILGGCAGSTSGGLKIIRVVALLKLSYYQLERTFRPKTLQVLRINGMILDEDFRRNILIFFVLYVFVFAGAALLLSAVELPFQTAISAVAATLNGVGPGLELVGAIQNYAAIPIFGKLVLCMCMVMGRLELLSIGVLFMPAFWKHG